VKNRANGAAGVVPFTLIAKIAKIAKLNTREILHL